MRASTRSDCPLRDAACTSSRSARKMANGCSPELTLCDRSSALTAPAFTEPPAAAPTINSRLPERAVCATSSRLPCSYSCGELTCQHTCSPPASADQVSAVDLNPRPFAVGARYRASRRARAAVRRCEQYGSAPGTRSDCPRPFSSAPSSAEESELVHVTVGIRLERCSRWAAFTKRRVEFRKLSAPY